MTLYTDDFAGFEPLTNAPTGDPYVQQGEWFVDNGALTTAPHESIFGFDPGGDCAVSVILNDGDDSSSSAIFVRWDGSVAPGGEDSDFPPAIIIQFGYAGDISVSCTPFGSEIDITATDGWSGTTSGTFGFDPRGHEVNVIISGNTYTVECDGVEAMSFTTNQYLSETFIGLGSDFGSPVFNSLFVSTTGAIPVDPLTPAIEDVPLTIGVTATLIRPPRAPLHFGLSAPVGMGHVPI